METIELDRAPLFSRQALKKDSCSKKKGVALGHLEDEQAEAWPQH